ncbi:fatty-acyl-CoA synthase [Amycolatopsis bartoniae]|uniref:Acyl-CoA synthetase n=1 Tax=Amycolatopsis bartoniae TaxID=941986 RepID=A0A8H9J1Y9_9PSEU|nr:AMP-binding protein [Amycolatopsis bartoniae]MBB2936149.1 fatty-acyl-CoA synthase [Amycolatopsis bartoniae]TVT07137.1 AMP-binding protein [Amycolatopsis bartoniae]GHF81214.1 acyl-CoA synthetase [Amycolatopsis bartoniae]
MDGNLATVLERLADELGDRDAVVCGKARLSWRELDERAARRAALLAGHGIGRGSRVGIALFNGPGYLETVFAVLKLRALPVNVNYRYRERELAELLGGADARALVYDPELEPRVRAAGLPGCALVPFGDVDLPPLPRIPRSPDDEWLMFTGGTTGRPKGVLASQRWLGEVVGANAAKIQGRTTLVAPPLMHGTGLYLSLGCLVSGGTVAYLPSRSFDPDELAREIERLRVAVLVVVGDVFAAPLNDALDRGHYDVSSLQRVVSAGVTWSSAVKEGLLRHCDAELEDMLAASEGGPFARSVTSRKRRERFELLPGCRVLGPDDRDVEPGSGVVGRIAAPTQPETRYLDDPSASAATFRVVDGTRYVFSGDFGTIAEDGSLVLLGRGSRVINTGGEKVFAEEVEQVLATHPAVQDVIVVGAPDPRWGQRVVAVVVARGELTADEVSDHVGAELAGYKRPRDVVFVPEIRRSPAGKADLAWVREVVSAS